MYKKLKKINLFQILSSKQQLFIVALPYIATILLLIIIYIKSNTLFNADLASTQGPKNHVLEQNTSDDFDPSGKINENITLAYDGIEDVYKQITPESKFIYAEHNKGVFIHQIGKPDKPIIQLSKNQTIVQSLSPNKRYLVYTIANQLEENKMEEGALTILDLETMVAKPIFHIPQDKTFTGIHRWGEDSSYFYFTFRSSTENLHFPDPQTTLFYKYDLKTNFMKYLAKGSDFLGGGHTYIHSESIDKKHIFFTSTLHGDPLLVGAWKLNLENSLIEQTFKNSYNSDESYADFYSQISHDKEKVLISHSINKDKISNDGYTTKYGFLNLNDGKITYLNIPLENNLSNLDMKIWGEKLYVRSESNTMTIYDLKSEKVLGEFNPLPDHLGGYFFSLNKDNSSMSLQLTGYWKDHVWTDYDDIRGIFDLKTKDLTLVNYYKLEHPKYILTIL